MFGESQKQIKGMKNEVAVRKHSGVLTNVQRLVMTKFGVILQLDTKFQDTENGWKKVPALTYAEFEKVV